MRHGDYAAMLAKNVLPLCTLATIQMLRRLYCEGRAINFCADILGYCMTGVAVSAALKSSALKF